MDHKICVNCKYAIESSNISMVKCGLTGAYCRKTDTCEYFEQNAPKENRLAESSQRAELRAEIRDLNERLDRIQRQLMDNGTFMDVLLGKIVSIDKKIDNCFD